MKKTGGKGETKYSENRVSLVEKKRTTEGTEGDPIQDAVEADAPWIMVGKTHGDGGEKEKEKEYKKNKIEIEWIRKDPMKKGGDIDTNGAA